jgi:anti-anti-sigma regulatory factor
VLIGGLDFAARREFLTNASRAIDRTREKIELDCSAVDVVDEPTVGMLVMLARNAQRRGVEVVLDAPTPRLRRSLDDAGVRYLFSLKP